ncbi:hypothetical protein TNCV_1198721 [Trichonephila clavipes]|uniref:Uncharacterized protein n=1 Tax=Trichonephila clavipes TaxID=2585209 RepID=A0A8X6RZK6_TRICX|nr:hypothetical protein TNCV_1198721 [Trichonephila clavipes]
MADHQKSPVCRSQNDAHEVHRDKGLEVKHFRIPSYGMRSKGTLTRCVQLSGRSFVCRSRGPRIEPGCPLPQGSED